MNVTAIQQLSLFCIVGLANTMLDFGLYNALTRKPLGWSRIKANFASTTVAMVASFTLNLLVVFSPHATLLPSRAFKFMAATFLSLYVVQNLVIHLSSRTWLAPAGTAVRYARKLSIVNGFSDEFLSKNGAKALATMFSLACNFVLYKFYVYAN